jgi:uncharacterized membrane-anchored protein
MEMLTKLGTRLQKALSVVTDWLLIVMGMLLVLIALWRIDVPIARYVVVSGGMILTVMGGWYRWRRLRKEQK